MQCVRCGLERVTERTGTVLNRAQHPSDAVALVDVLFSERRDMVAARAFFRSARSVTGITPDPVTTDGHNSYPRAIHADLGRTVHVPSGGGQLDGRG